MTKNQHYKRYFTTLFIIGIIVTSMTILVIYSLYIANKEENDNKLNSYENKYNTLVQQETVAKNYLNSMEKSSDEKKRNAINKTTLKKNVLKILKKVSETHPYYTFNLLSITDSNKYINVVNINFKVTLKNRDEDNSYYDIYHPIMLEMFNAIKNDSIRELKRLSLDKYSIVYKKPYI